MKAVIMAGGEGSRLRPLTCSLPKPMARLCGKPIIEYIFELLLRNGIEEAAVTLGYLPDLIEEPYREGFGRLKLTFLREERPLGTAGSVKNAARGWKEPFLVISGDAMCDYRLSGVIDYHRAAGAAATIVAAEVEDPREYGLLKLDHENRVTGFIEKPAWGQAVTNLANTGIYLLNAECLELIPEDEPFDFAKDLFPRMLAQGMPVYAYHATGYWCDVGDLEAYMRCGWDLLDGKIECKQSAVAEGIYTKGTLPQGEYSLIPPVYLGEQLEIGSGAVIGPHSSVDDGCLIGEGAKLRGSALLENACLGPYASVTGALLCAGASLKSGAAMFEGAVSGAGTVVGARSTVKPKVLIWPGKTIEGGTIVNANVKYGSLDRRVFDDDGIHGESGLELVPEVCARLGAAMGSAKAGKRVGVAYDGTRNAKALLYALIAGLMQSGSHVWNFGECFEAQLSFFTAFCSQGVGIFVHGGENTAVKVCGEGGLSVPRFLEREIETRMAKGEFQRCAPAHVRDLADMSSIQMIYRQELGKLAPYGLTGCRAAVKSGNERVRVLLQESLLKLNCTESEDFVFRLNRFGTQASAYTRELGTVPCEKLLAICCLQELKRGRDLSLPFDAPQLLDTLALEYGRQAYRYLSSPADDSDSLARQLSAKQQWVRDGLFLAVRLLSIMKEREKTLAELLRELPEFYIAKKTFSIGVPPSMLTEFLGGDSATLDNSKEGIRMTKEKGRLLIVPSRTGKALSVLAEANNMEAANELCVSMENLLQRAKNNYKVPDAGH